MFTPLQSQEIIPGAERINLYINKLIDKKVAVIANNTSIIKTKLGNFILIEKNNIIIKFYPSKKTSLIKEYSSFEEEGIKKNRILSYNDYKKIFFMNLRTVVLLI